MMPTKTANDQVITFYAVLPALVFIVALNLTYIFSGAAVKNTILSRGYLWMAMFLAFPLAHILIRRASVGELGYRGDNPLRFYARGLAIGTLWRFFDVVVGYFGLFDFLEAATLARPAMLGMEWIAFGINDLLLTPLFEETFFRGFLQVGLEERTGAMGAIVIQALLFATHPYHVVQSLNKFPSIFIFGLVAGIIYWRTRSIIPVFGAHGWANFLPKIIRAIASLLWCLS